MGRDFTPREQLAAEQYNITHGMGSIWDYMENAIMNYNGEESKLYSKEELELRKQFSVLGKLLANTGDYSFSSLYEKLSQIDGGIDLLHSKDKTLVEFIETNIGDYNSPLIKWFYGELDPNFHYCKCNNELFGISLIEEAILLASKDKFAVAPLPEMFLEKIEQLDEMSGNCVAEMVDEDNLDFAWGLFKDGKLVGYCTIGGADETEFDYPGYSSSSLLLSDVFVVPEYRGQGAATFLVNEAIRKRTENDKQLVFLTVLDDNLSRLYEKCGFEYIEDGVMVRDERVKSIDEKLINATERSKEQSVDNGKNDAEFVKE